MAWTEENVKVNGKDINVLKNKSSNTFNMPIDTKIKIADTFEFAKEMYSVTSVAKSRDEFLIVLADANTQPKPEGKPEDDKSKEG